MNWSPTGSTNNPGTPDCVLRTCTSPNPVEGDAPSYQTWTYDRGEIIVYDPTKGLNPWSSLVITTYPCPAGGDPLLPRDSGYTVGVVRSEDAISDRLIILGGDQNQNCVYYSDVRAPRHLSSAKITCDLPCPPPPLPPVPPA